MHFGFKALPYLSLEILLSGYLTLPHSKAS
jgi:hypothetical protein